MVEQKKFLAYLDPSANVTSWGKHDVRLMRISGSVKLDDVGIRYYDKKRGELLFIPLSSILHIEEGVPFDERAALNLQARKQGWYEAVVYYHKQDIEWETDYVIRVNHTGQNPFPFKCIVAKMIKGAYVEAYTPTFSHRIIIPLWLLKGIKWPDREDKEVSSWPI